MINKNVNKGRGDKVRQCKCHTPTKVEIRANISLSNNIVF